MSKENAEKFMALYQQHKAIAKRLAELEAKSDDALLDGLVELAKDMGLEVTGGEIREASEVKVDLEEVSGGKVDPNAPDFSKYPFRNCY